MYFFHAKVLHTSIVFCNFAAYYFNFIKTTVWKIVDTK